MNKYTVTIETDDLDEFQSIVKHSDYQALVFYLKRNFFRKFQNLEDSEDFHRGVEKVLDELYETIDEHLYEN